MKKSTAFLFMVGCLFFQGAISQNLERDQRKRTQFAVSGQPIYGFVFAHDPQVKNTAGTMVTGFEFSLNRYRVDSEAMRYSRKMFNSGFTLSFFRFSKDFLGWAIGGSYFIEPYIVNHKNFKVGLMGKVGLTYNSNPYNARTNNGNNSYSLLINPYLSVGMAASLSINERYSLSTELQFNHNSNGNVFQPNYGINFPTASMGLVYHLNKIKEGRIGISHNFDWRFDFVPFSSFKTIEKDSKRFYWVHGFAFQVARKVGFFNTISVGSEWIRDPGDKKLLEISGQNGLSYNRFGFLVGHEFIFKKFDFSQQIGIYAYNKIPYLNRIYHRWGINYKVIPNCMIGLNLEAHKQIADFLDFRFVYSLYR